MQKLLRAKSAESVGALSTNSSQTVNASNDKLVDELWSASRRKMALAGPRRPQAEATQRTKMAARASNTKMAVSASNTKMAASISNTSCEPHQAETPRNEPASDSDNIILCETFV